MKDPQFLSTTDVAKLYKKSTGYIRRLCRLPKSNPKHIKNKKLTPRCTVIIDEKVIDDYLEKYC